MNGLEVFGSEMDLRLCVFEDLSLSLSLPWCLISEDIGVKEVSGCVGKVTGLWI